MPQFNMHNKSVLARVNWKSSQVIRCLTFKNIIGQFLVIKMKQIITWGKKLNLNKSATYIDLFTSPKKSWLQTSTTVASYNAASPSISFKLISGLNNDQSNGKILIKITLQVAAADNYSWQLQGVLA